MKRLLFLLLVFMSASIARGQDSLMIRNIYDEELLNGNCYENLRYLCKKIGPRLTGSINADKAVQWSSKLMQSYHFDRVYLQEVRVPHWIRGPKEQAVIINNNTRIEVAVTALGMSIGTSSKGIKGSVVEVRSLKQLDTLGESGIKGKIVFLNHPLDPRYIEPGEATYEVGNLRSNGPAAAAKYGALAVVVRSLTESLDDYPHTGTMHYAENGPKIPAAAISTKGADQLSFLLSQHSKGTISFFLRQRCKLLPDKISYNVIVEYRGSTYPNSYIIVSGHLDSWDLAEGAHDDGTGIMQAIETVRIFKTLNYRPRNSVRVVFFMNEENGTRGGIEYTRIASEKKENHIAAIESDLGGFTPRGFDFTGLSKEQLKKVRNNWGLLLAPYDLDRFTEGYGGGTDIAPLGKKFERIVLIGFEPDQQRYLDIHHTARDVFENVNKRELELGAASIAGLVYLIDQHGFD